MNPQIILLWRRRKIRGQNAKWQEMSWIDDRVSNAKKQVEITATPKMEEEVETNTWPAWQEYGKGGGGAGEGEWGQMKDSQISPLLLCRFSITWKSLIKLGKETFFCQQNRW